MADRSSKGRYYGSTVEPKGEGKVAPIKRFGNRLVRLLGDPKDQKGDATSDKRHRGH
jgi:hypothetical protein